MADDIDSVIADWINRVDKKIIDIEGTVDKGLIKSAFFCEGQAKINAEDMIYKISIPIGEDGKALWKRTGLYKASIGSGIDTDSPHSAIVYNTAPYSKKIEYGTSDAYGTVDGGRQGRPVLTDSVFKHKDDIKQIMETFLKQVID